MFPGASWFELDLRPLCLTLWLVDVYRDAELDTQPGAFACNGEEEKHINKKGKVAPGSVVALYCDTMTPGTATFPRHCVRQCHPCLWWHLAQPPSLVTVWDNVTRVSDDTWHSHLPMSLCETMSPVSLMTPGTATFPRHCVRQCHPCPWWHLAQPHPLVTVRQCHPCPWWHLTQPLLPVCDPLSPYSVLAGIRSQSKSHDIMHEVYRAMKQLGYVSTWSYTECVKNVSLTTNHHPNAGFISVVCRRQGLIVLFSNNYVQWSVSTKTRENIFFGLPSFLIVTCVGCFLVINCHWSEFIKCACLGMLSTKLILSVHILHAIIVIKYYCIDVTVVFCRNGR